jgi:hypothetical protein
MTTSSSEQRAPAPADSTLSEPVGFGQTAEVRERTARTAGHRPGFGEPGEELPLESGKRGRSVRPALREQSARGRRTASSSS